MLKNQIVGDANKPTFMKRRYPESVLMAAAEHVNKLNERGIPLLGELGQPSGQHEGGSIHLERVSHKVENARVINGQLLVDIKVLDTPMGKVLKTVLDKAPVDFRMRSFCNLSEPDAEGVRTVSDLKLVTFDAVSP